MKPLKGVAVLMNKRKPSEASSKAYRDWSDAVDNLNAVDLKIKGDKFCFNKEPAPKDLADKASLEARVQELNPVVARDFPLS